MQKETIYVVYNGYKDDNWEIYRDFNIAKKQQNRKNWQIQQVDFNNKFYSEIYFRFSDMKFSKTLLPNSKKIILK